MNNPNHWHELRTLLCANAISMIGNSLTLIAIPWFVYELTESATVTGGIVLVGQLPNILIGLFSGHFIDRFSAKAVSMFTDAINFLAVLAIPLFYSLDLLNILLLSSLVFLAQALDSPGSTARRVLTPELIDKHNLPREKANGLDSLVETAADIAGPIIGGLLLSVVGALTLLVIDAATFAMSFLIIAFGIKAKIKVNHEKKTQNILQVWRWLVRHNTLLKLALYDTLINMVATPLLALCLPIAAKNMGDASLWLGIWLACFAAGTTLTTAIYTLAGHRTSPLLLLKVTPLGQIFGLVIVMLVVTFKAPLILISLGLFIYGMNLGVGSMVDAIMLQKNVPEDRRGSVFAAFSSLRYAGVPFGLLITGIIMDYANLPILLTTFCVLLLIPAFLWAKDTPLSDQS